MGKAVTLSELVVKLTLDSQAAMSKLDAFNKKIASSMNQQAGATRRVNNNLQSSANSASNLNNAGLSALDTYTKLSMKIFGIYQTLDLAKKTVAVGFEVEGMEAGLTAILGADPKNAGKDIGAMVKGQFDYAKRVAEENGKDLMVSMDSWMRLSASAAGKVGQSDMQDIFRGVSDYGTVLGISADRMKNSYLAIQQMLSKGVVQSEELKRQLAEHMPGALQVFARSIGKTDAQVIKMLRSGELVASEVLPAFGRELSRTANANGALAKKQKGALAASNRLKNAFEELSIIFFKGGLADGIVNVSKALTTLLLKGRPVADWLGNFVSNLTKHFVSAFKMASFFVMRFLDIITGGKLKGTFIDYLLEKFEQLFKMKKGTATIDNLILSLEDLFIVFLLYKTSAVIWGVITSVWALFKATRVIRGALWVWNLLTVGLATSNFLLSFAVNGVLIPLFLLVAAVGLLYYVFSGKLYNLLAEGYPDAMDFLGESISRLLQNFDPLIEKFNKIIDLRDRLVKGTFMEDFTKKYGLNKISTFAEDAGLSKVPQTNPYLNEYVSKSSGNNPAQTQQNNEIVFNVNGNLDKTTGDKLVKSMPIMLLDSHAP